EYVAGKWLGLVATVLIYAIPAASIQMVLVQLVVDYSPPHPLEFLAFVIGEAVVVLTLSLLFSTRFAGMVGGVSGLILWGLAWMGGIVGSVGLVFDNATLTHVGTASKLILPTDGLWRGAVWSLEPASLIPAAGGAGASALAPHIARYAPRRVVASLEPKATETGSIIAERLHVPFTTAEGLHEHDRRAIRFLGADDFAARMRDLFAQPDSAVFG